MYEHIDADEDEGVLPCGPRIMSLIVYLQAPEFGGEIEFPELKLSKSLNT